MLYEKNFMKEKEKTQTQKKHTPKYTDRHCEGEKTNRYFGVFIYSESIFSFAFEFGEKEETDDISFSINAGRRCF